MKTYIIAGTLACIIPMLAVGPASAADVYKIGVATGQTGYLAVTDGPALQGLQLGVEEINGAGGIAGKWPIELDIRNTNSEPSQTATVTQQLLDAGAKMILTPCDLPFARDGIAAESSENVETLTMADVNLADLSWARAEGTVRNLRDRRFDLYHIEWDNAPDHSHAPSGGPVPAGGHNSPGGG